MRAPGRMRRRLWQGKELRVQRLEPPVCHAGRATGRENTTLARSCGRPASSRGGISRPQLWTPAIRLMYGCGMLLLLGFLASSAAIPTAPPTRVDSTACSGSACPTWPSAVHIEGALFITTTASNSGNNATVTGEGTAIWATLGDQAKPGASLSYTRRFESMSAPGEPAGSVGNTTTELWQICPQHKQYRNVSSSILPLPGGCVSLPMPCFHRYDPVSLAIAACKSWTESHFGATQHFAGSRCDFAGFHIPGQTGTFDAWYDSGKISRFQTNTTTLAPTGGGVLTETSETVTVTSYSDTPDPAVFHTYCKPSS